MAVALIAMGCVSVPAPPAVTEGHTTGGIAYDVRGRGPTVVLVHGAVLDRRMWDHEAGAWGSRFRVVRYDLRGHGKSVDVSGPFSAIDDLVAVLDAVGAPKAHVVGLSKGAQVALDFALSHPDRVDRLVLAGAAPSGMRPTEQLPGVDSLIAAIRRGDVERAAAVTADMPAFAAPPDRAEWVRSLVMDNARLYRQSPTAERPSAPPAITRLNDVRVRTLIIVGERDSRDILMAADSLAGGIPGAQRVTIPGAGHLANIWQPGAFDQAVRRFLGGARE